MNEIDNIIRNNLMLGLRFFKSSINPIKNNTEQSIIIIYKKFSLNTKYSRSKIELEKQ